MPKRCFEAQQLFEQNSSSFGALTTEWGANAGQQYLASDPEMNKARPLSTYPAKSSSKLQALTATIDDSRGSAYPNHAQRPTFGVRSY